MGSDKEPTISQAELNLEILKTLQAIRSQAGTGADVTNALAQITDTLAGVANRARPENPDHTGISAYSYPEGDYEHPKPKLKCEMFWVGYPETAETLRPDEIDALNTLRPGNYQVTKANGNRIPFNVDGKVKMDGTTLESLSIWFPCKQENSTDHRSKVEYCAEAMGTAVPSLLDLQMELAKVRTELATATAVIAAA